MTTAEPTPTMSPAKGGHSALDTRSASTTPTKATNAPTDRSIPAVRMTIISARAMRPKIATWRSITCRLKRVPKLGLRSWTSRQSATMA